MLTGTNIKYVNWNKYKIICRVYPINFLVFILLITIIIIIGVLSFLFLLLLFLTFIRTGILFNVMFLRK